MKTRAFMSVGGIVAVALVAVFIAAGSFVLGIRYGGSVARSSADASVPLSIPEPPTTSYPLTSPTTGSTPAASARTGTLKLFGRASVTYDPTLFTSETGTREYYAPTGQASVTANQVILRARSAPDTEIVTFIDMVPLSRLGSPLEELVMTEGAKGGTTLRPVTVQGRRYTFTRRLFGEGMPEDETGTCMSDNEIYQDTVALPDDIGVAVTGRYSGRVCNGQKISPTRTPEPALLETALTVIESLKRSGQ